MRIAPAAQFTCLTLAGTLSAFLYHFAGPAPTIAGGGEAYALALSLAHHGTFADPFVATGETGPSAHLTPLFPAFLAMLMRLAPAQLGRTTFFLAILARGVNAALMPPVSKTLLGTRAPGLIAAALSILLPVYQHYPLWDAIYSADLVMMIVLACCVLTKNFGSAGAAGAGLGALFAFCFLLNPIAGVLAMILCLPWVRSARPQFAVAAGLMLALGMTPWIVRNYRTFGRFVPLRDDLGLALYSSNNSCAQATLYKNLQSGCHQQVHPIGSQAENKLVAQLGEVTYNRQKLSRALSWMRENPSRLIILTVQRAGYFWFPPDRQPLWLTSALGLCGILALLWVQPSKAKLFLAAIATYSFTYYFVEAQERYLYPVYWLILLGAGYLLSSAAAQLAIRRIPSSSETRTFRPSSSSARLAKGT